ncbi:MAG: hypothetical protein ACKOQ9_03065, partial [Verrucomicrobiota bacterium]
KLTAEALEASPLPPGDDDPEEAEAAHEESLRRAVRSRLLASVEERTRGRRPRRGRRRTPGRGGAGS